jgi:hypothetical protein
VPRAGSCIDLAQGRKAVAGADGRVGSVTSKQKRKRAERGCLARVDRRFYG